MPKGWENAAAAGLCALLGLGSVACGAVGTRERPAVCTLEVPPSDGQVAAQELAKAINECLRTTPGQSYHVPRKYEIGSASIMMPTQGGGKVEVSVNSSRDLPNGEPDPDALDRVSVKTFAPGGDNPQIEITMGKANPLRTIKGWAIVWRERDPKGKTVHIVETDGSVVHADGAQVNNVDAANVSNQILAQALQTAGTAPGDPMPFLPIPTLE